MGDGRTTADIPLLLLVVTEICLMLQVSKGISVGKLLFTQGTILIAKISPNLASTEFKAMPCVVKKFFLSLQGYWLGS